MSEQLEEMTSKSVLDSLFGDHFNIADGQDEQQKPLTETPSATEEHVDPEVAKAASGLMGLEVGDDGEVKDTSENPAPKTEDPAPTNTPEANKTQDPAPKVTVTGKSKKAKADGETYEIPKPTYTPPTLPRPQGQEEDLSFLSPEQKDEYELIKFGEAKFPDRFKGRSKELLSYYKSHEEFVKRRSTELEELGEEFDVHDTEYQKWIRKNQPKFSYEDRRDLREERTAEKVLQRLDPKLRQHEDEIRMQKIRPIHDQIAQTALTGFDEATKEVYDPEDRFEKDIHQHVRKQVEGRVGLYLSLIENPDAFDGRNQAHKAMDQFITDQGKVFFERGGAARIRDGKKFLPVSDYLNLPDSELNNYWTFSEADIVRMLRRQGEVGLNLSVENHRKRMEESGYVRKSKGEDKGVDPVKKEEVPKKETPRSPKVTSAPVGTPSGDQSKDMVDNILGTLFRS